MIFTFHYDHEVAKSGRKFQINFFRSSNYSFLSLVGSFLSLVSHKSKLGEINTICRLMSQVVLP